MVLMTLNAMSPSWFCVLLLKVVGAAQVRQAKFQAEVYDILPQTIAITGHEINLANQQFFIGAKMALL